MRRLLVASIMIAAWFSIPAGTAFAQYGGGGRRRWPVAAARRRRRRA